jgi:hypothetical protein
VGTADSGSLKRLFSWWCHTSVSVDRSLQGGLEDGAASSQESPCTSRVDEFEWRCLSVRRPVVTLFIRIDPQEMIATAAALRGAASEVGDVGSQLRSCVNCPMPPQVEATVNQLISTSDQILDVIASRLTHDANDLTARAALAAHDPVAAASLAVTAGPGPLLPGATVGSVGLADFGAGIIGGGHFGEPTILPPGSSGGFGAGIIGGGHYSQSISSGAGASEWEDFLARSGGMTIGGHQPSGGFFAIAEVIQNRMDSTRAIAERISSDPNSSAFEFSVATNALSNINTTIGRGILPGRDGLSNQLGVNLTPVEYGQLVPGGFDGNVTPTLNPLGLRPISTLLFGTSG